MPLMTDDEPELDNLVDDARTGAESAFTQLVLRVQTRVRAWAARYTDDADEADDIAQSVLIGLQRRVQQYRGESRFSTWLFSVTKNTALNHVRSESRRMRLRDVVSLEAKAFVLPETNGDYGTVAALILKYFDTLPPKQRMIFELCDLRGEQPAEVARRLGMTQVTVRSHLFKARRAIRARMLELHEPLIREYFS